MSPGRAEYPHQGSNSHIIIYSQFRPSIIHPFFPLNWVRGLLRRWVLTSTIDPPQIGDRSEGCWGLSAHFFHWIGFVGSSVGGWATPLERPGPGSGSPPRRVVPHGGGSEHLQILRSNLSPPESGRLKWCLKFEPWPTFTHRFCSGVFPIQCIMLVARKLRRYH